MATQPLGLFAVNLDPADLSDDEDDPIPTHVSPPSSVIPVSPAPASSVQIKNANSPEPSSSAHVPESIPTQPLATTPPPDRPLSQTSQSAASSEPVPTPPPSTAEVDVAEGVTSARVDVERKASKVLYDPTKKSVADPKDTQIQSFAKHASIIEPSRHVINTHPKLSQQSQSPPASLPSFPSFTLTSGAAKDAVRRESAASQTDLSPHTHRHSQQPDADEFHHHHHHHHHAHASPHPAEPNAPPPPPPKDRYVIINRNFAIGHSPVTAASASSSSAAQPQPTSTATQQPAAESASTSLSTLPPGSAKSPTQRGAENDSQTYLPELDFSSPSIFSPVTGDGPVSASQVGRGKVPATATPAVDQQDRRSSSHGSTSGSFHQDGSVTTSTSHRNSLDRPLSTLSQQLVGNTNTINATAQTSRYNIASYSLTNNPDAVRVYGEMAKRTNDPYVQLAYAKYLIQVAKLFQPNQGHTDNVEDATRGRRRGFEREAVRWVRRLSEQGIPEAALMEATWMEDHLYGYSGNHNKKIERLYRLAVGANLPEAYYRLAARLESSNRNSEEALFLFQRAAEFNYPQAIYKIAKIHLHGELGQPQNLRLGMEHLMLAVNASTEECSEPPYVLALILTNRYSKLSVPTELTEAFGQLPDVIGYMEQSANLGNVGAKNRAGHIYEHGSYGIPMDVAKAFSFYTDAANKGHLQSMLALSRLYNRGCHGPSDDDEQHRLEQDTSGWFASHDVNPEMAFSWCRRAARGGLPDASFLLGWYYEIGLGIPRNYQYAMECFEQAAAKGQLDAKERLEKTNSFTRQQHQDPAVHSSTRISRDFGSMRLTADFRHNKEDCNMM
ncbi:hypothetical protein DM01DRAFT_1338688 [Hesseltinella vesiculosa]|uniref:HCP-like protein n=1 Tax=Hesseltinella vesiculosa TaxID=101127 RepID=A0A1X2G933_9FUNG|nr:hypothetical protein DM01DRAFT_1338688 [Hesseltinella vesiculosa]